jgi:hypothetical protein
MQMIEKIRAFCHARDNQHVAEIFRFLFSMYVNPDDMVYLIEVADDEAISMLAKYAVKECIALWDRDLNNTVGQHYYYSSVMYTKYQVTLDRQESNRFNTICLNQFERLIRSISDISDEQKKTNESNIRGANNLVNSVYDKLNHGKSNGEYRTPVAISGDICAILRNYIRACDTEGTISSPDYIVARSEKYKNYANAAQIFQNNQWRYMCSVKAISKQIDEVSKNISHKTELFNGFIEDMKFYEECGAFEIIT